VSTALWVIGLWLLLIGAVLAFGWRLASIQDREVRPPTNYCPDDLSREDWAQ
jgi:hypothetical protein